MNFRRHLVLAGALFALVVGMAWPAWPQDFPRVAVYGANRGGGAPFISSTGQTDTALVRKFVRGKEMVTLDVAPWGSLTGPTRRDVTGFMRLCNPKVKLGMYFLVDHWYLKPDFVPGSWDQSFPASWQRALVATNGWTWTTAGTPKPEYEVDWSRRVVADTLGSLLCAEAASGAWDFFFGDYMTWQVNTSWISQGANPVPNYLRSGWFSHAQMDSARKAELQRLVKRLRAAGGPGFLVLGNGDTDLLGTDGGFREGFPNYLSTATPEAIRTWQTTTLRPGWDWIQSGTGFTSPVGPAAAQAARYVTATACVWGTLSSFGVDRSQSITYQGWNFDEYSVTPYPEAKADTTGRGAGWLGEALGPAREVGPNVWRRDFTYGVVLLNNGSTSATVDLGAAEFMRIRGTSAVNNGQSNRTETVGARDGLFLMAKVRR